MGLTTDVNQEEMRLKASRLDRKVERARRTSIAQAKAQRYCFIIRYTHKTGSVFWLGKNCSYDSGYAYSAWHIDLQQDPGRIKRFETALAAVNFASRLPFKTRIDWSYAAP